MTRFPSTVAPLMLRGAITSTDTKNCNYPSRNIMIAIELLQNEEERKKKEKERERERERRKKISNWNYITIGQKRD